MGDAKRRKQSDPSFGKNRRVLDIRSDKSVEMFSNLPPGTTSDDYLQYLDQNWDVLAPFAYEGFLNEGRGILLLDWDLSLDSFLGLLSPDLRKMNSLENRIQSGQVMCPSLYMGTRRDFLGAFLKDANSANWLRLIQGYDPRIMVVIALCWGFSPKHQGQVMARTLALPNHKSPAALYVENADRIAEFGFLAGTNQAVPSSGNQIVRSFHVAIEHDAEFRQTLKTCFLAGAQRQGKGAVVAIPESRGFQAFFVPQKDLISALGADEQSRPFQQLQAIVEMCDPATQVAAVVIDSDLKKTETFEYHSFLVRVDGDDRHG